MCLYVCLNMYTYHQYVALFKLHFVTLLYKLLLLLFKDKYLQTEVADSCF